VGQGNGADRTDATSNRTAGRADQKEVTADHYDGPLWSGGMAKSSLRTAQIPQDRIAGATEAVDLILEAITKGSVAGPLFGASCLGILTGV